MRSQKSTQPFRKLENKVNQLTLVTKTLANSNPYANTSKQGSRRPDEYPTGQKAVTSFVRANLAVERARYFYALLNPYATVIERMPVVVPSIISIPTTPTYHLQRASLITTSSDLHIRFCPILVPLKHASFPFISVMISDNGTNTSSAASWRTLAAHPIFLNMTKGRLVGMEVRLRYTGTVLNQSGTIESAMTFGDDLGERMSLNAAISGSFTDLPDLNFIHQMTWYDRREVTRDSPTRLIWVPVDYNDRDFKTPITTLANTSVTYPEAAADVCWYAKISGLAAGQPILIEIAEVWEQQINAAQDVYARTTVSNLNANSLSPKALGQALAVRNEPSFIEQSASAIGKFATSGIDYVSQHAGELAKMGLSALAKFLF